MTNAGRMIHEDSAALLEAHLLKDILLNGICSTGTDDKHVTHCVDSESDKLALMRSTSV